MLLERVYCVDAGHPERIDAINEEDRQKLIAFIEKFKTLIPCGTTSSLELTPRFAFTYLGYSAREFEEDAIENGGYGP